VPAFRRPPTRAPSRWPVWQGFFVREDMDSEKSTSVRESGDVSRWVPLRFVAEPIQVTHEEAPVLKKDPECPDQFVWRRQTYQVVEQISAWRDYERRGLMARNMAPKHLASASRRGSWGVGRLYYRVRTNTGQVFDVYYDRRPRSVEQRKGQWFLYRELREP